ncbi:ParA family protein [Streptomyces sp. NPDC059076]|uniref:ParA family protein n=1 Tax=unclassified Streptomyces TaxID=2593676 RepID=UPI0036972B21
MARISVVLNRKGGIGKSTITVNTAAVTADVHGESPDGEPDYVVAVSIDPQGSATWWSERVGDSLPFSFIQAHTAEQLTGLAELKKSKKIRHIFVDTPGWADISEEEKKRAGDDLGDSAAARALRAVLAVADDIIVPIEPEPLGFQPTQTTIENIIKPRRIPYRVVISNWDPRDGVADLEDTKRFVLAQNWPLANTVIRHYKVHARAAAEGQVVTQYAKNRVAMEAREDFFRLALELGAGGKGTR